MSLYRISTRSGRLLGSYEASSYDEAIAALSAELSHLVVTNEGRCSVVFVPANVKASCTPPATVTGRPHGSMPAPEAKANAVPDPVEDVTVIDQEAADRSRRKFYRDQLRRRFLLYDVATPDWPKLAARVAVDYFDNLCTLPSADEERESVTAELLQAGDSREEDDDDHPTFRPQTVQYGTLQAGDPELDRLVSVAASLLKLRASGVAEAIGKAAHLIDACRDYRQRQTDDAEVEAARVVVERDALRLALVHLRDEVASFMMPGVEIEMRDLLGNADYAIVKHRLQEADAVLDSVRPGDDAETED